MKEIVVLCLVLWYQTRLPSTVLSFIFVIFSTFIGFLFSDISFGSALFRCTAMLWSSRRLANKVYWSLTQNECVQSVLDAESTLWTLQRLKATSIRGRQRAGPFTYTTQKIFSPFVFRNCVYLPAVKYTRSLHLKEWLTLWYYFIP